MLSTLAFAGLIATTWGHGRLTKPMTRIGNTGYENDPIGFGGRPERQYICRHDNPNPTVTPAEFTAGQQMTVQWITTARHVGDCALYMSYDTDAASLEDMRWFKIANRKDCKSFSQQDVNFALPEWLPAGDAVLRWEWYALHVTPTIEFYAQCADIKINNPTGNAISKSNIPTFKVYENGVKTSLPINANTGVGFRNPFQTSNLDDPSQYMTGPECAFDSPLNDCALTAEGERGWVELAKSNVSPVTTPTSPPSNPVEAPTEQPTMEPVESPTQPPTVASPPVASPTQPPVDSAPVVSPTQPPVVSPPVMSPTQPPVVAPTADGECTTPLYQAYEQCAGDGWDGLLDNAAGCPVCPSGYQCYQRTNWYSNCNHSCPQGLGWDCDDSMPAPTPPPSAPPADTCNPEFATCGGMYMPIGTAPGQWNGVTCCEEGLECVEVSIWYSQCSRI